MPQTFYFVCSIIKDAIGVSRGECCERAVSGVNTGGGAVSGVNTGGGAVSGANTGRGAVSRALQLCVCLPPFPT